MGPCGMRANYFHVLNKGFHMKFHTDSRVQQVASEKGWRLHQPIRKNTIKDENRLNVIFYENLVNLENQEFAVLCIGSIWLIVLKIPTSWNWPRIPSSKDKDKVVAELNCVT